MTTPIHQWLEGKRNLKRYPVTRKMGRKSSRQLAIESYNRAIDDLIADSPSLLSAMEAEIRGKIGENEEYTLPDPKHLFLAASSKGDNEEIKWAKHCVNKNADRNRERAIRNVERSLIHAIIHEVLNPQE